MTIDTSRSPDEGSEGADATAGDSGLGGGMGGAAATPSRVDAGGGYLADRRQDAGVNWLLLAPLLVGGIVIAPRVRARFTR